MDVDEELEMGDDDDDDGELWKHGRTETFTTAFHSVHLRLLQIKFLKSIGKSVRSIISYSNHRAN